MFVSEFVLLEVLVALPAIGVMYLLLGGETRNPARVRLTTAAAAVLVSAVFVLDFSEATRVIAQHRGFERPMLEQLYELAAPWALTIVVPLLVGGRWVLRQVEAREFWTEVLAGCSWLFAFAWALGCILAAHLQELPLVHLGD